MTKAEKSTRCQEWPPNIGAKLRHAYPRSRIHTVLKTGLKTQKGIGHSTSRHCLREKVQDSIMSFIARSRVSTVSPPLSALHYFTRCDISPKHVLSTPTLQLAACSSAVTPASTHCLEPAAKHNKSMRTDGSVSRTSVQGPHNSTRCSSVTAAQRSRSSHSLCSQTKPEDVWTN
jgi:hypothetical protein